jgi:plastocyanin
MTSARHLRNAALLTSLVLTLGACASSAAPNWTYAPPPSPSASPSASAGSSASPSAGASPAASAASPLPSGSAAGNPATALNLVASGLHYDKDSLEATANKPFQINFDNQDQATMHNVQIADATNAVVWKGDIVTGPAKTTYTVTPLAAATYTFYCVVHPDMKGTLTVK